MLEYVLLLVTDARFEHVVTIIKKKGPAFLLEKETFPGGKIEPGESINRASSREMFEETGLTVDPGCWTVLNQEIWPGEYVLTTLHARLDDVSAAEQKEMEPVFVRSISDISKALKTDRSRFAPDFSKHLDGAFRAHLGLIAQEPVAS